MGKSKLSSKSLMTILIGLIGLVTYNIVLFISCGFEDHGGAFWVSYVFMMLAFVTLAVSSLLLKSRSTQPKDWLLGYPVMRHCTIYLVCELITSTLFVILDYHDCPFAVAFAIQMILFAIHLVFIISCFLAKEIVEEIQVNVKTRTSKMKLLQVDVEMLAESTDNMAVRQCFLKLAEQIRYSDPMSNDALKDLEDQIAYVISQAKNSILLNDADNAILLCNKASSMLNERNKKCKILK